MPENQNEKCDIRKYAESEIDEIGEQEWLEVLLYITHNVKNTNELARNLLEHFGSIDKVLNALPVELTKFSNLSENAIFSLSYLRDFVIWYKNNIESPKTLNNLAEMKEYCVKLFKFVKVEEAHVVFLDSNNFIKEYRLGTGRFSQTSLDIKDFISLAIDTKCKRLFITHSHPNSSPAPSHSDISETLIIRSALSVLDIELIDHIIVGANGSSYSMKEHGLLDNEDNGKTTLIKIEE